MSTRTQLLSRLKYSDQPQFQQSREGYLLINEVYVLLYPSLLRCPVTWAVGQQSVLVGYQIDCDDFKATIVCFPSIPKWLLWCDLRYIFHLHFSLFHFITIWRRLPLSPAKLDRSQIIPNLGRSLRTPDFPRAGTGFAKFLILIHEFPRNPAPFVFQKNGPKSCSRPSKNWKTEILFLLDLNSGVYVRTGLTQ